MIVIIIWIVIWIFGHGYIKESHKIYKSDKRFKGEKRLMKGRKPGSMKKHIIWFIISSIIFFIVILMNPIKSNNNYNKEINNSEVENIKENKSIDDTNKDVSNIKKNENKETIEDVEILENPIITETEKASEVERITNSLQENQANSINNQSDHKETIINLINEGKSNSEIHKQTGFKRKEIKKTRKEING